MSLSFLGVLPAQSTSVLILFLAQNPLSLYSENMFGLKVFLQNYGDMLVCNLLTLLLTFKCHLVHYFKSLDTLLYHVSVI